MDFSIFVHNVYIAALLEPLHDKLVERNKQLRLEAAKKTIEELDEKKVID